MLSSKAITAIYLLEAIVVLVTGVVLGVALHLT